MTMPHDLSTYQVAARLGFSPRMVVKWFDAGLLSGYRVPGSKCRRITPESVEAFVKEHGITPGSRPVEHRAFSPVNRRPR